MIGWRAEEQMTLLRRPLDAHISSLRLFYVKPLAEKLRGKISGSWQKPMPTSWERSSWENWGKKRKK